MLECMCCLCLPTLVSPTSHRSRVCKTVPTVLLQCVDCNHCSFQFYHRYVRTLLASLSFRPSRRGRRHKDYPHWPEQCAALHLHFHGHSGHCRAWTGPGNNSCKQKEREEEEGWQESRQDRDTVAWLVTAPRRYSPCDTETMTVVTPVWTLLDHQVVTVTLPCFQLCGRGVLVPFRDKPLDCFHSTGLLKTNPSAAVRLETAPGLQANGPLLYLSCIH